MSEHAVWSGRAHRALEALHVPAYFSTESREAMKGLGLHPGLAYFAVRSAPMGAVPAEVVEASFYVFAPRLVRQAVPGCWSAATPEQVLAARHDAVGRTLHRILDPVLDGGPDPVLAAASLAEAVDLATRACEALPAPGRPLYAGHASLPWPDDPLLRLWHAATLLREHRGDGHVAALVAHGVGPVEAMLSSVLAGSAVTLGFLRRSRGWTDEEWDAAARRLRGQGLVRDAGTTGADGAAGGLGLELTEAGVALRQDVEARTDAAARAGWEHLGPAGTRRLAELVRPLARAVQDSGALAPTQVR